MKAIVLRFRPLSGSYISQYETKAYPTIRICFRPLSGSYISQSQRTLALIRRKRVSVPYRGATFLNRCDSCIDILSIVSVPYRGATFLNKAPGRRLNLPPERFRPLSGSYISQYHPRNPMFCLGQIGGLRGKSNFIEMQPFWKVKNSHKSSI